MFKLFKKDEEEYNYFKAFAKISLQIVEVNDLLSANLKNNAFDTLEASLTEIQRIDKSVIYQKKELLDYLYEDFLPPIERKDILNLLYSVETVLKETIDLVIHLDMYQIEKVQPKMRQLTEIIGEVTQEIPQLMKDLEGFKHPQKIKEALRKMNDVNNQGVNLYQQAVKNLYSEEINAVDTIKYDKIYEQFNQIFRSIEQLMNLVEAVIIENT